MRRENRGKVQKSGAKLDKIILYTGIGIAILAVIVFALFMYSKSLNEEVKNSTMSLEKMASIVENNTEDTESASTDIGKTVEESKNEITNNTVNPTNTVDDKNSSSTNTMGSNTTKPTENNIENNKTTDSTTSTKVTNADTIKKEEVKQEAVTQKELSFQKPVDGEIVREYAKDNLIYSATLDEWTTHMGIDIKAEKTTVVKASEEGTVKSIKNDPRYGLTIVIEHENNFQTVYSNLLTSEFVVEGEKVTKGQSIGTVGNTAVFEIADEPHLHFEILKDSLPVDPNIYIK